jgi:hypothetical protein
LLRVKWNLPSIARTYELPVALGGRNVDASPLRFLCGIHIHGHPIDLLNPHGRVILGMVSDEGCGRGENTKTVPPPFPLLSGEKGLLEDFLVGIELRGEWWD